MTKVKELNAEIIQLTSMDDNNKEFNDFVDNLKEDNVRGIFIFDKKDGTMAVGTNTTDRRDLVYDLYRLHRLIEQMIVSAE